MAQLVQDLRAMLNSYRATLLHPPGPGEPGVEAMTATPDAWRVRVPTRVIWGERDGALLHGLDEFVRGIDCPAPPHWHALDHLTPLGRMVGS